MAERPRLQQRFREELLSALKEELGYPNAWQVPRPEKIVVNMGVGEAARDAKVLDGALAALATITGQKPL
ncbi:MAG: 50S ribosomal protein L5, partial [Pseudonocardiaceae bacterium]